MRRRAFLLHSPLLFSPLNNCAFRAVCSCLSCNEHGRHQPPIARKLEKSQLQQKRKNESSHSLTSERRDAAAVLQSRGVGALARGRRPLADARLGVGELGGELSQVDPVGGGGHGGVGGGGEGEARAGVVGEREKGMGVFFFLKLKHEEVKELVVVVVFFFFFAFLYLLLPLPPPSLPFSSVGVLSLLLSESLLFHKWVSEGGGEKEERKRTKQQKRNGKEREKSSLSSLDRSSNGRPRRSGGGGGGARGPKRRRRHLLGQRPPAPLLGLLEG